MSIISTSVPYTSPTRRDATSARDASDPNTSDGGGFGKYTFHPLVMAFPRPTSQQIEDLAEEIRRRGGAAPILKRGEMVLDDYARVLACERAGVELKFREWDGIGSLAEVVTRAILPQTHLSDSQRAAIAVPISDHLAAETVPAGIRNLKRGQNPQKPRSEQTGPSLQNCSDGESPPGATASEDEKRIGRAAEFAAKLCHVSPRYVYEARKLRDDNRDLYEQVKKGTATLSAARVMASKQQRADALMAPRVQAALLASQPATRERPKPARGDELIIGDCLDVMGRVEGVAGAPFHLIFADPPYNLGWKYDADPTHDLLPAARYLAWCEKWIGQCARLLARNGSMFVLIDSRWQHHYCRMLEKAGLHWRNTIIWRDPFPTHTDARFQPSARFLFYFTKGKSLYTWHPDAVRVPSRRDEIQDARRVHDKGIVPHDVWDFPRVVGNSTDRVPWEDAPPQVPSALIERCILAASDAGDRVFDPFTGNGTTWRAARKLGRLYTGIERSRKYAGQAEKWAMGGNA